MLSKTNVMKIFFCVLAMTVFALSKLSYADWVIGAGIRDRHDGRVDHREDRREDRHFYRWHDHPRFGLHVSFLPEGYFTVWLGGARYYYYDGLYYTYVGAGDYVLVNPPLGVYVSTIPSDFQPVLINGRTYYTNNGVYYILTEHHGYKVVSQPVTTVVTTPAPAYGHDSFPVNIPNKSGGYTTVIIRKSGNGYVGPQGEFYAAFPSVAQLKVMYVK